MVSRKEDDQMSAPGPLIATRKEMAYLPLTMQQEWALRHWVQTVDPYIVPFAVRLHGPLCVDALRRSLAAVLGRHGALRTRIAVGHGTLLQVIDAAAEPELQIITCSSSTASEAQSEARRLVEQFFMRPLDFAIDPPCRAMLLQLCDHTHVLAIVISHMVCDGISARIFRRELWTLYADIVTDRPPSLAGAPLQYADYTLWQQSERRRSAERHEHHWRDELAQTHPVRLPVDAGLEDVTPFSPASVDIAWPRELSSGFLRAGLLAKTTPALVMLTLYSVVLSSRSGQRDIVIPFAIPGRMSSAQASIIGFFSHYLPVRIRIAEGQTFIDLLKQVSSQFISAHEHVDFGKWVGDFPDIRRGTSLNWSPGDFVTSTPSDWSGASGLPTIEAFPFRLDPPPGFRRSCDTLCYLRSTHEAIWGFLDYRGDLFRAETMQRLCARLKACAELVVRNPDAPVESF
jgi:hypothetical protein